MAWHFSTKSCRFCSILGNVQLDWGSFWKLLPIFENPIWSNPIQSDPIQIDPRELECFPLQYFPTCHLGLWILPENWRIHLVLQPSQVVWHEPQAQTLLAEMRRLGKVPVWCFNVDAIVVAHAVVTLLSGYVRLQTTRLEDLLLQNTTSKNPRRLP